MPKTSGINEVYQIQRRLQAVRTIQFGNSEDIHYSSVFTISNETYYELHEFFLNTIEKLHKTVDQSSTQEMHAVCLDFFRWV